MLKRTGPKVIIAAICVVAWYAYEIFQQNYVALIVGAVAFISVPIVFYLVRHRSPR